MKLTSIVLKELFVRKSQLLTGFLAILLGIAVIVSIRTISHFSAKAVAYELDTLGTNVLILPKSAMVENYYTADLEGGEMPESYVDDIVTSDLKGVDNLSPKLTIPVTLNQRRFNLTGILPKNEFAAKPSWQVSGDIFDRPSTCGVAPTKDTASEKTAVRRRVIKDLKPNEVLIGTDVANILNLAVDSKIKIKDRDFEVKEILPVTGTVDDSRIFAHLHTVQEMAGKPGLINVIEIVGCCREIAGGLIDGLNRLLPDARVVTIKQIVQTQQNTNTMMEQFSLIFLIIIVLVGCFSIANYMFSNVQERRKEIGTLLAIGCTPYRIMFIFLFKALLLGLIGGGVGYVVGTGLAVILGPRIAHITILPLYNLFGWSILIAVLITGVSSIIPAIRAARLDPAQILQEQ